jgi:hypothetical protein
MLRIGRSASLVRAVLALGCFIAPSVSLATGCGDYKDKTLVSLPFAAAAASLPKIDPKSEFETTAAYNARVAGLDCPAGITVEDLPRSSLARVR